VKPVLYSTSSTLRRLGVALACTNECRRIQMSNSAVCRYSLAISRHDFARGLQQRRPPKRGSRECRVRAAPAVSRAKGNKEKRTRAYRFSGSNPAFPAQWFYGLYRALLGERIRLVTVAAGLIADRIRLDRFRHRQLGTSNGCRDHTVLPYATTPFVCAPVVRSQAEARPAIPIAPDAAASTTSHPASVTIAIRPSWGMRRADS
jgi:hypothetical protein